MPELEGLFPDQQPVSAPGEQDYRVKLNDQEFTAESLTQLQQWTAEGRVPSSALIFHPTLERWMYASEMPEIAYAVAATDSRSPYRRYLGTFWTFLILAIVFFWAGIISNIFLLIAFIAGVMALMNRPDKVALPTTNRS